jgi:hypothetical protein
MDLSSHRNDGKWARRLTQSPELGVWLLTFLSQGYFGFYAAIAIGLAAGGCVVVRTPLRSPTDDAAARQFARRRNDRPFLSVPASALGQLQAPAPEITVDPERSQNVMRTLHQQRAQIRIALFADVHSAVRSALSFAAQAAAPDNSPRRGSCGSAARLPASAERSARSMCPRP